MFQTTRTLPGKIGVFCTARLEPASCGTYTTQSHTVLTLDILPLPFKDRKGQEMTVAIFTVTVKAGLWTY